LVCAGCQRPQHYRQFVVGTPTRMLINVGVILYFIPYMYMFAALVVLQREVAS
jgi:hypothetical protein